MKIASYLYESTRNFPINFEMFRYSEKLIWTDGIGVTL